MSNKPSDIYMSCLQGKEMGSVKTPAFFREGKIKWEKLDFPMEVRAGSRVTVLGWLVIYPLCGPWALE